MAKASYSNTTRRAALSACLAVALPLAVPASAATSPNASNLRPTKLGLELMRSLPAYAEAVWIDVKTCDDHSCPPEIKAARQEAYDAAYDRVEEIVEAIHEQAAKAPLQHLIDVAIVLSVCSDDPLDAVEGVTLEEVGALSEDGASVLAKTLALALLKLARISPDECSVHRLYQRVERSKIGQRSEEMAGAV